MILDRVASGTNVPVDVNAIIEIPAHSDPVKYKVDKDSGAMFVDRFMTTAMYYPCNYGYIPRTLLGQVAHFFEHYKDLDEGKWVRVDGWGNVEEASVERYRNAPEKPNF